LRSLLILTVVAGALANAGAAAAGCWATVGLAPPPEAVGPGETWSARITVLQHGRNPLPDAAGARPRVTVRNPATGESRMFTASPTGEPGVYLAEVVFPSAGAWRYEVFDDFTTWDGQPASCARTHMFGPVTLGGALAAGGGGSPGSSGGGVPLWPVLGGSLAALAAVAVAGAAGWSRRRHHTFRPTT
jgi:YtkA-like